MLYKPCSFNLHAPCNSISSFPIIHECWHQYCLTSQCFKAGEKVIRQSRASCVRVKAQLHGSHAPEVVGATYEGCGGWTKAGLECGPKGGHDSVWPVAGQGRAVASWRPALLQCCWGRGWWPQEADMGSWAMGKLGGALGVAVQGEWCLRVPSGSLQCRQGRKNEFVVGLFFHELKLFPIFSSS